eukprot:scaffold1455_cov65-Phaeocystis_antarctica.AAC.17
MAAAAARATRRHEGARRLGRVTRQRADVLAHGARVGGGRARAGTLTARVAQLGEPCRVPPVITGLPLTITGLLLMLAVPERGELSELPLERAGLQVEVVGDLLEADELEALLEGLGDPGLYQRGEHLTRPSLRQDGLHVAAHEQHRAAAIVVDVVRRGIHDVSAWEPAAVHPWVVFVGEHGV